MKNEKIWWQIEERIEELITAQKKMLLNHARQIIPHATADDILQPNDFLDLELNPHFRYEEGTLHGMQALQTALRALQKEEL